MCVCVYACVCVVFSTNYLFSCYIRVRMSTWSFVGAHARFSQGFRCSHHPYIHTYLTTQYVVPILCLLPISIPSITVCMRVWCVVCVLARMVAGSGL